ncbi:MAG TPA: cytidine deaminase [Alphaproteobacteria bacterium]|nr:cytidine deaminase [Alphaproteobacteria bacterium]
MSEAKLTPDERESLLRSARQAMQNAYAPYSGFFVGAAILTDKGEVFTGCNVENASYGLTNCAERTAIFTAVAKLGVKNLAIRAIAVVNQKDVPCSPCGACRQVMGEFAPKATVIFRVQKGYKEMSVAELLPHGFKL